MKTPDTSKPVSSAPSKRNFSKKSTATAAQRDRILAALRQGPQTSYALRLLGCYQAPARIKELRDKLGFTIETELVTLYDHEGYMHPRAARYHLREVPQSLMDEAHTNPDSSLADALAALSAAIAGGAAA